MGTKLQAGDPITEIRVIVHTADVNRAGTDDNVYLRLFQIAGQTKAYQVQLQGSFERGNIEGIVIPPWYWWGMKVNDISIVQLYKDADSIYGGWGFKYIELFVNGENIYSGPQNAGTVWLEDESPNRHWTAPDFVRIEYATPDIQDSARTVFAEPGGLINYSVLAAGGKPDIVWKIDGMPVAGVPAPTIVRDTQDQRKARVNGKAGPNGWTWTGTVTVTDALSKSDTLALTVQSVSKLAAPTISSVDPQFGWCSAPPAGPGATIVTIRGQNFDTRPGKPMGVSFVGANGKPVPAALGEFSGEMVTATVPDGAVSGPVTVTTEAGSATSAASITVHPSGYRFADGYAFANRMKKGDSTDGFPDNFDWDRYEEAFGVAGMWIMTPFGEVVPDPASAIFFAVTFDLLDKGCCHGFSLTSLRIRERIVGDYGLPVMAGAYPLEGTLHDKANGAASPSVAISHAIQAGQLVMMSSEALFFYAYRLATTGTAIGKSDTMDARPMLGDVKAQLAAGWTDPRMIAFSKAKDPTEGHVVVAHAVDAGNRVHVYNSNDPVVPTGATDDPFSRFSVAPATGDWSFDMGSPKESKFWSGAYCFTIPLSAYGHQSHWTVGSLLAAGTAAGAFYFGSCVGGSGTSVEPLDAGLRRMPVMAPRPVHALGGKTARFRVSSPDRPGMAAVILDSGITLSIEEVHGSAIVDVDLTAGTVRVTEEALRSDVRPVARLVRRNADRSVSRTYAVRASAGTPRGAVGLKWTGGEAAVIADVASVDIHARRVDAMARDVTTDLAAIPRASAADAAVSLAEDGTVRMSQPNGRPLDLTRARRAAAAVPAQVATVARTGPAMRAGGRATGFTGRIDPVVLGRDGGIADRLRVPPIFQPGPATQSAAARPIDLDVGAAASTFTVRNRAVTASVPRGRLRIPSAPGNRVEWVVEEAAGYRGFPRPVLVSEPGTGDRAIAAHVVLAEQPGVVRTGQRQPTTVAIPLTLAMASGGAATGVTIDLVRWKRVCGAGDAAPVEPTFALSPALAAIGAKVTPTSVGRGGLTLAIDWPDDQPQRGRIALGSLTVAPPALPGSIWTILGEASVQTSAGEADARVVPIEVRVAGQGAPATPRGGESQGPVLRLATWRIDGPASVREGEEATFTIGGAKVPANGIGWWVRRLGGEATPVPSGGPTVRLKGMMAGAVRLYALVGDMVVSQDVRVEAVVGWSALKQQEAPFRVPAATVPPRRVDPVLATPQQRFRDPVWNPETFSSRIYVGKGVTLNPIATAPRTRGG